MVNEQTWNSNRLADYMEKSVYLSNKNNAESAPPNFFRIEKRAGFIRGATGAQKEPAFFSESGKPGL